MKLLNQLLSIQEISQKCDVPKSTLRFWEKKFGDLLAPMRSKGGRRRYSTEQVAVIRRINHMKAQGLSLEEIHNKILSGTDPDRLPSNLSIEILGERIAALVRLEICRFMAGELQNGPPRQASAPISPERGE